MSEKPRAGALLTLDAPSQEQGRRLPLCPPGSRGLLGDLWGRRKVTFTSLLSEVCPGQNVLLEAHLPRWVWVSPGTGEEKVNEGGFGWRKQTTCGGLGVGECPTGTSRGFHGLWRRSTATFSSCILKDLNLGLHSVMGGWKVLELHRGDSCQSCENLLPLNCAVIRNGKLHVMYTLPQ